MFGKYAIVAPRRSGAEWLTFEAQALGLKTLNNPVDVGIRVEVQSLTMSPSTSVFVRMSTLSPRWLCICRNTPHIILVYPNTRTFLVEPTINERTADIAVLNGKHEFAEGELS